MNFQVVGGSFKEHSPFVVLNDHFIDGNSADDIIADELNKNYIGWILVVNENDPTINSLVHATNYEYKNKGGSID